MTDRAVRTFYIHVSNLEALAPLRELVGEEGFRELLVGIGNQVAETLRGQRDPQTEEFPVVTVYPVEDDRLRVEIEGSEALHEFLARRLPEIGFNLQSMEDRDASANVGHLEEPAPVSAFLAHAHEDRALALRIASFLHAKGIRCLIDHWELGAGDSIKQKLEGGIDQATHFLVLLTPASLTRPWVRAEIDAGFIGLLGGRNRFVGIRHGVSPQDAGRFLETLWLPKLDVASFDADMQEIANEILGVTKAPPVAAPPAYARTRVPDLSAAATQVAKYLVEHTEQARIWDPQVSSGEMAKILGMVETDVIDAYEELKALGCIKIEAVFGPANGYPAGPTERLFVRYDRYWKDWDPAKDAIVVARMAAENPNGNTQAIMEKLGWNARRMNPALSYLIERDLVMSSESKSQPLVTHWIQSTDATRRFLKQAS